MSTKPKRRLVKMYPTRVDAVDVPATGRPFLLMKRADVAALADTIVAEFGVVARAEQLSHMANALEKSGGASADQLRLIRDTAASLLSSDDENEEEGGTQPEYEETDLVVVGSDGSERPVVIAKAASGPRGGTAASNVQDVGEPMAGGVTNQADLKGAGIATQNVSGPLVVRRKPKVSSESPGTPDNLAETQLHHDADGDDDVREQQRSVRYTRRDNAVQFNEIATPGYPAGQTPVGGLQKRGLARAFVQYLLGAASGSGAEVQGLQKSNHSHPHMHDDGTDHTHSHDHMDGTLNHSGDETMHDHEHGDADGDADDNGGTPNMQKADKGQTGSAGQTGSQSPTVDALVSALNKSISEGLEPVNKALKDLTDPESPISNVGLGKRLEALEAARGMRKSAAGQESQGKGTPNQLPEFGKGMFDNLLAGARLVHRGLPTEQDETSENKE